ncbi:MAG: hypothetical protein QF568_01885 [Flavobacteriales bacterium]|jgi:malate dehydrogenase|nr:hypothetical protein [Flavobacteriales bacterium]|tara:strand:+ start:5283 stop:6317 length:1035 start_codon:yes stop_codon:yes gene_type:complete
MKNRYKIVVYGGAGQVGYHSALLTATSIGDIPTNLVLVDFPKTKEKLEGLEQKIKECSAAFGNNINVSQVTNDKEEDLTDALKDADIIVNAAGFPRGTTVKIGKKTVKIETRDQLNEFNAPITMGIANDVGQYAPEAVFLQVANQTDTQTGIAYRIFWRYLKSRNKVISVNHLDQARLISAIGDELGFEYSQIYAPIGGTHDNNIVPFYSLVEAYGASVLFNNTEKEKITQRVKNGGSWMINKLRKSSEAEPGAVVASIIRAMLEPTKYKNQIFDLGIYLGGEWGYKGAVMGLPCTVTLEHGAKLIKKPENLKLEEINGLNAALKHSKEMYEPMKPLVNDFLAK